MKKIKTFVEDFFQAEATASDALVKPNLEDYNENLEIMNSFCIPELHNKFGMVPRTELWHNELYEEWKYASSQRPRHIYKISHYEDENYSDIYIAYVSGKNPPYEIFRYAQCIFITMINNELKIVKSYSFEYNERKTKKSFKVGIGLPDISFDTLENPISIKCYVEPTHDEESMKHYDMGI